MAAKKLKSNKPNNNDLQQTRRTRWLQIAFAAFCLMVVLSMVLSAVSK